MKGAQQENIPVAIAGDKSHEAANASAAMAHVHKIVARSGSSFLWGMRVLPKARREAMYAIYAFCRLVDDIADEPGEPLTKLEELAAWRREIEALYAGRPSQIVSRALLRPIEAYALPKAEFLALIDGMEMDVRDVVQTPTQEDFKLYCRRVAGAVGMLSVHVFGETGPAAQELAVVLGEALQTTNILRDLAEDAERGRIYLPRDLLQKHGIIEQNPDAILADPALAHVCAELAEQAHAHFTRARSLLAHCDRRRVRPATLMLEAYDRILTRLEARGWSTPEVRVSLPGPVKLWVALRYSLF